MLDRREAGLAILAGMAGAGCSASAGTRSKNNGIGVNIPDFTRSRLARLQNSDVILSVRFANDGALDIISTYRPNRIEWHYISSAAFVKSMRERGASYISGAINTTNAGAKAAAVGIDGKPMIAPWMKGWGKPFASATNPATVEALSSQIGMALDSGADGIQVDDVLPQWSTEIWSAGDFSQDTITGFGPWLRRSLGAQRLRPLGVPPTGVFDFKAYLAARGIKSAGDYATVRGRLPLAVLWRNYMLACDRAFFAQLRPSVPGGRRPPFSANIGTPSINEYTAALIDQLDYVVTEMSEPMTLPTLAISSALLAGHGIKLVPSPSAATGDVRILRRATAAAYAVGAIPLIPWDIFVGPRRGVGQPRFYGQPQDFVDLFDFVRTRPELFDGWESSPSVAIVAAIGRTSEKALADSVLQLLEKGIAFSILTCGGEAIDRPIDHTALKRHSRLIIADAQAGLPPSALSAIRVAGVPLDTAGALDAEMGGGYLTGAAGWSAVPRRNAARPYDLLYHIVPNSFDSGRLDQGATLILPRWATEHISSIRLFTPRQPNGMALERRQGAAGVSIGLPAIDDWGILLVLS